MHLGREVPRDIPSCVTFDTDGVEDFSDEIRHIMQINLEITILVFGLHLDLPVAWAALQAGARGFLHAGMEACQVVRAVDLATKGVLVAPRKLLEYLVNEEFVDTGSPSMHQREILTHVAEGLSNAEVAERLNLSEFTTKRHLRHA